jgi:cob(I)alamin adenosyltransferase
MEKEIDKVSATLEPIKEFVMPRGSVPAAFAHVARTVCRRAERLAVAFFENMSLEYRPPRDLINELYLARTYKNKCNPEPSIQCSVQYLNRLSDYLFVLARKYRV